MADWLESAWLARYLERRLSAEETAGFEAYALDKPGLLELIDSDTRLRDALAAERPGAMSSEPVSGSIPAASPARDPIPGSTPGPRRRHLSQPLALAASLLLAVTGGWFAGRSLLHDGAVPAVIANPDPFVVETMRGDDPSTVRHPAGDSPYVLIEAAVPGGAQDISLAVGPARIALRIADDGLARALVSRTAFAQPDGVVLEYRMNGATERKTLALASPRTNP
ncbi:MAG TPA: hypothetical protein VGC55_14395 [Dokdonella sp.]